MKRLHIITLAVLAASVLALGVTTLVRSIGNDKTIPEIVCSDTPLRLSVQDGEAGLLQDVTARDGNDGDLTGSLIVQRVERTGANGGGSAPARRACRARVTCGENGPGSKGRRRS